MMKLRKSRCVSDAGLITTPDARGKEKEKSPYPLSKDYLEEMLSKRMDACFVQQNKNIREYLNEELQLHTQSLKEELNREIKATVNCWDVSTRAQK